MHRVLTRVAASTHVDRGAVCVQGQAQRFQQQQFQQFSQQQFQQQQYQQ